MAHYRDGTPAAIGDVVRGRGYNIPHGVQGVVVGITPGAGSCDLHVAYLRPHFPLGTRRVIHPAMDEEHGTCAEFELVHRHPSIRPAPSDDELADVAFAAYGESTGGLTHDGKPIPPLEAIRAEKPGVARAWAAAAGAVRKLLGV